MYNFDSDLFVIINIEIIYIRIKSKYLYEFFF